jgi:hypothetical protein
LRTVILAPCSRTPERASATLTRIAHVSAKESLFRGEHLHIFFLVDSDEVQAQSVLNTLDGNWLALLCEKHGLDKPWINGPQNKEVHGERHHAALPYLGPNNRATPDAIDRLADSVKWLTYIYKARDKHDEEWQGQGQIFAASRPKRSKQIVIPVSKRQQADNELAIKIETGDCLLDRLIAQAQHAYAVLAVTSAGITLH